MKSQIKILVTLIVLLSSVIIFVSCGGDENESKSMDQIMSEDGVPVQVQEIKYQPFNKYLSFFAKLTGIKEATKGAMVGGKIEKINAVVGSYVKEKQVIVEFDTYNPAVQYDQAKTAYENLAKNYERMKALLAAGETSQSNFDGVETQYLVAKRNYESVHQMLFVESPFDGTIVDVKVNAGDNVKSDTHLFTVSQLHKMRSKIWVSEKEIVQFKKGMKAVTEFAGQTFTGRVVEISLAMDPARQSFYVEVEFDNPKGVLKSGITTEIKILVYENPNAVIISRNLINNDENGSFVYIADNGKAVKTYITNGNDSGINYEIKNGLQPGQLLIVKGSAQLEDGSKIKVIQ